MAIKTQIRLAQLTGSIDDGSAANDPTSTNKSLAADSLQGVLDAVGAGLQKIHGAASFNLASAGEFSHSITPNAASSEIALGSASKEWADLYLGDGAVINLGDDQDVTLTHVADTGILLNSTRAIAFSDGNSAISNPGAGLKLEDHAVIEVEAATSIQLDSPIVDFEDDGVALQFGDGDDVVLTHIHDVGLRLTGGASGQHPKLQLRDSDIALESTADGEVGLQADLNVNIGTRASGVAIAIGHGTSEVTVGDNLTVEGDLTVNGTTTTVNSANLTIDDAIILLGQGNNANLKDLGMILERGGNNVALFLDETDDVFKLGFTAETASDDEITVADGALTTQVDKLQITGSAHFISFENRGGGDTFNIKSSGDFFFDADGGKIMYTDLSAQTTNAVAYVLDMGTDQQAKFKDGNESIDFFTLDSANSRMDIDSTIRIANGGSSTGGTITFLEDSDNGTNFSVLRGPRQLADDNTVFELPADNGISGYVLQTDGSGLTSWVAKGSAGNSVKTYATIQAAVAADANLSSDGGYSVTNFSAISTENAAKAIDVYVNGQLLQSGSGPYTTDVSAGSFTSGDYLAKTLTMNALDIKFAFALEADDVVCIIGRA